MKKGFTIIELLMVVVLIGLLTILIIPNVNRLINKSTQTLSSAQVKSVEDSALNFITDYYDYVKSYDVFTVELKMLKDLSYVEPNIKNVKTGKFFSDDSLVTFTRDGEQYKASFYGVDSDSVSSNIEYYNHILFLKGANIFISNNISDKTNAVLMDLNGKVYASADYSSETVVTSTNNDDSKIIAYNITLIENTKQYDFSITREEIGSINLEPQFTISITTNLDKSQLTMTIVPDNVELGTNPYSFDNGVTWQPSSSKVITSSFDGTIKLKDANNNVGTLDYNISKLTISANGGVWNSLNSDSYFWLINGATMTVSNPIRPGYTFSNWIVGGDGSSINGTTFTMGTADTTITANWVPNNYILTVNANGGSWSGTTPQTIACGTSLTIVNPTRANYTFNGWTLSGTGSSISGTTFTMGSANASLTANWTINTYTLTVNANGGSWSGTTPQSLITGATSSIVNPTRSGYVFTGWSLSGSGSSISGTTFTMGSANTTLTANWLAFASMFTYTGSSTIVDDGNSNFRIKFLSSGTFTPLINMSIDVFLVGGGGAGSTWNYTTGAGGGGGGYTNTVKSISITANTGYYITIGNGGSFSGGRGYGGEASYGFGYGAAGGGGEAWGGAGTNGGSGGGGYPYGWGGADGSTAAYANFPGGTGQGTTTREFGEAGATLYAYGGNAVGNTSTNGTGGSGGGYGGGPDGTSGIANSGSGGGGGYEGYASGYGGSGIVIIRNHR